MNNIASTPQHPLLVQLLTDVVVWTYDVELTVLHLVVHVFGYLGRCPSAIWLAGLGAGHVTALALC
jgi:hypothetical protein